MWKRRIMRARLRAMRSARLMVHIRRRMEETHEAMKVLALELWAPPPKDLE